MSPFYCSGKKKIVKVLEERNDLREAVKVFYNSELSAESIASVGERLILALCNAPKKFTSLNIFRFYCSVKCVAGNRSEALENNPPSKAAAEQHSYRVYLQIQAWLGNNMVPTEWGWKESSIGLLPVETTLPAAPPEVLKLISCGCKKACGPRCGCRKAGLPCSSCHGTSCLNVRIESDNEEDYDSDELFLN